MEWKEPIEKELHLHKAILIVLKGEDDFPKFGRMTQTELFTEFDSEINYELKDIKRWLDIPSWQTYEELVKKYR